MLRTTSPIGKGKRRSRSAALLALVSIAALPSACGRERLDVGEHASGGAGASGGKRGVGTGGANASVTGEAGESSEQLGARGGRDAGGEGGSRSGNGGTALGEGAAQSGGRSVAGEGGVPGMQTPPPAPDYCADLNFEFDGQSCKSDEECPAVTCDCSFEDQPSAQHCDAEQGCLVDFDCDMYCRQSGGSLYEPGLLNCVVYPCQTDTDCHRWAFSTVCVRREDAEVGFCRPWDRGACVDEDDCLPEQVCEPALVDGTRACVHPSDLGCTRDADCDGLACAVAPGRLRGVCTTGTNFRECDELNDCRSGLSCVAPVDPRSYNSCTDGEPRSPCERDADCIEGRCLKRPNDERLCSTGQLFHTCEADDDCLSGLCVLGLCTSGELRSLCETSEDCRNGAACLRQFCSDGSLGTSCEQNRDCASLRCATGSCRDGLPGSNCDEDSDCTSESCSRMNTEHQDQWRCE